MNMKELRDSTISELEEKLLAFRKSQAKAVIAKATGDSVKTHQFKQFKKDIARVKTIMSEKKAGETNG